MIARMFQSWSDTKTRGSMVCPGGLIIGTFMNGDFTTGWGQWVAVAVAVAICLGVHRQLWLDAGSPQKIQSDCGRRDKKVPDVKRVVFFSPTKDGDEVIFEHLNGLFCWV